jgi:hypothetical protein
MRVLICLRVIICIHNNIINHVYYLCIIIKSFNISI